MIHRYQCMHSQRGLTLLELTVVMLILVSLATVALRSTSGLQDQSRWEQTKNRYEAIRAAIIGDPKLTINGQQDINGFVADMGRLPLTIHELLVKDYCSTDHQEAVQATCGVGWTTQTAPAQVNGLSVGWRGPYLITSQADTDQVAFSDGWGRLSIDGNYGWNYLIAGNDLTLQSFGRDQTADALPPAPPPPPYDADYPVVIPSIINTDWQVDISGGITVNMQPYFSGTCTVDEYITAGSCELAGGTWSGICTDNAALTPPAILTTPPNNRHMCSTNGELWAHNGCSDNASLNMAACGIAPIPPLPLGTAHAWSTPCLDNISQDKLTCETALSVWTPCINPVPPDSKLLCDSVGGTWAPNQMPLDLIVTYRDGIGGILTVLSNPVPITAANEDGLSQQVNFSFPPGTLISMGINNIIVTKAGTGDIYPSSCSGLTAATCPGGAIDFLPNGMCDNVTPAECTAAGGTLTKDTIQVAFIPYKSLPIINW